MQTRRTVRLLLLDASGRVLLMHMHDPRVGDADGKVSARSYWLTPGGEIEPGETLEQAARRELQEETGISNARLGPLIWTAEHVLTISGEKRLLQESFIMAHLDGEQTLSHEGWTAEERISVKELRWWSAEALAASDEIFYPARLAKDIPALSRGEYPQPPLKIDLR